MLDNEHLRLGELRKKHYEIAGVPLEQLAQDNGLRASPHVTAAPSSPKPSKPTLMKKPALAQKPNIPPKSTVTLFLFFFRLLTLRSFHVTGSCRADTAQH